MTNSAKRRTAKRMARELFAKATVVPAYGRGFDRMKERMGPKVYKENVAQVLKDQAAALSEVGKHRVDKEQRDRTGYTKYPAPKLKRRKPK